MPTVKLVREHQPRREIDRDDGLQAEDQIVDGVEGDLGAAEAHVRVHDIGVAVEPLAFALAFPIEQLQALDRPDGLDEGGVLLGAGLDRRLRAQPQDCGRARAERRRRADRPPTTTEASVGL